MNGKAMMFISIICVILCGTAVMALDNVTADSASTDPTVTHGGCVYTISAVDPNNAVANITAWDGETKDIVIPATIKTKITVEQQEADVTCTVAMPTAVFNGNTTIESVKFGDGEATITLPAQAFKNCSALKSVTFGNTVTAIPVNCFENCSKLETVTVSDKIVSIGNYAFDKCKVLKDYRFNEGLVTIGDGAFRSCYLITEIVLPDTVESIGGSAFGTNGESVDGKAVVIERTKIDLGSGLKSMGSYGVFRNSSYNGILDLPANLATIPTFNTTNWGFGLKGFNIAAENTMYSSVDGVVYSKDGKTLVHVANGMTGTYTMPDTVEVIGNGAFSESGVEKVVLNGKIKELPGSAFSDSKIVEVVGLGEIEKMGFMCFYNCGNLKALDLSSIVDINFMLAMSCTSLESVIFSENLNSIGSNAFGDCSNLVLTSLPDSLTRIDGAAFTNCPNVVLTELPASLTSIGSQAFRGTGIESIVVGEYDVTVAGGQNAFTECNELTDFTLKNVSIQTSDYGLIANGKKLVEIGYPEGFDLWKQVGSLQISADGKTLITCLQGATGTVVVPNTVTTVKGFNGFYYCTGIEEVVFEDGRTENLRLENQTFFHCENLRSIDIPANTWIGSNIFNHCYSFAYLSIGAGSTIKTTSFNSASGTVSQITDYFTFVGASNEKMPVNADVQDSVWISNGDGMMYKVSQAPGSVVDPTLEFEISGIVKSIKDITVTGTLSITGGLILADGVTLTVPAGAVIDGPVYSNVTAVDFDSYTPVGEGASSKVSSAYGKVVLDAAASCDGSYSTFSRITSATVTGFVDGTGVVVDLAGHVPGVPDGTVLVQYSVFVEKDGSLYLDPFRTAAVDVDGESTVEVDVGERIQSCIVAYRYDFAGTTYTTPASEGASNIAADFISIDTPEGVEIRFGDNIVSDGDYIAFGNYSVTITVPEGDYVIGGVPVSDVDTIVYHGQVLKIEAVA